MKTLIGTLLALTLTARAGAQEVIRYEEHQDASIQHQADSLRELYVKQGYIIVKESSVSMESQFEFPVLMPLKAGTAYQFVFISEVSSRLSEVRMFDWSEKMVFYKKHQWGDIDGNIIAFPYVARQDEYHLMKVLQINKHRKKGLGGYVMLLRRTHSQIEMEEQAQRLKGGGQTAGGNAAPPPAKDTVPPAPPPTTEIPRTDSTKKKNHYDDFLKGGR